MTLGVSMGCPVYLINLDASTDRLARMESLLGKLGVPFEVVPAVCGKDLTEHELGEFRYFDEMDLGPGEYGCLLSHVKVWRAFLASGEECCFVLEDDLHFAEALDPAWLSALPVNKPWVLKLETFLNPVTIERAAVAKVDTRKIFKLLTNHAGTASYAISRAGAQRFFDQYTQMRRAIDTEMFSHHRRTINIGDLAIYQMVPAPCMQDMLLPVRKRELAVTSVIGANRADKRQYQGLFSRAPLGLRLRKLARPIYRRFRSLLLSRKGQARIAVNFK